MKIPNLQYINYLEVLVINIHILFCMASDSILRPRRSPSARLVWDVRIGVCQVRYEVLLYPNPIQPRPSPIVHRPAIIPTSQVPCSVLPTEPKGPPKAPLVLAPLPPMPDR
jgi:hypothetical protein